MTAPNDGPNGLVGDRVHQLPAVARIVSTYARTLLWPLDAVTRQLYAHLGVEFIETLDPADAVQLARQRGVMRVFALFADPSATPTHRVADAAAVSLAGTIADGLAAHGIDVIQPSGLDPRGRVPLWKRLYASADRAAPRRFDWPGPPFLTPGAEARDWARSEIDRAAGVRPVLVISPFSGGDKSALTGPWWLRLAHAFSDGAVLVPVYGDRAFRRARRLFAGISHVCIVMADLTRVAAIGADPRSHVIGIDGGRMMVLAAAAPRGTLAIFGRWPASAWAMPNMVIRDRHLTPEEALLLVP